MRHTSGEGRGGGGGGGLARPTSQTCPSPRRAHCQGAQLPTCPPSPPQQEQLLGHLGDLDHPTEDGQLGPAREMPAWPIRSSPLESEGRGDQLRDKEPAGPPCPTASQEVDAYKLLPLCPQGSQQPLWPNPCSSMSYPTSFL